jgi:hypothetical protein
MCSAIDGNQCATDALGGSLAPRDETGIIAMQRLWLAAGLSAVLSSLSACAGGLSGQPAQPIPATAFVHVNLVPMTEETVVKDQAVLIRGRKIVAIGPSSDLVIPKGALVVDGAGAYLMPGLADMHIHTRENWLSGDWPVSPFDLYLANGVTTTRDFSPGGPSPEYALRWRDEIAEGKRRGPTLYVAARLGFGPAGDAAEIVERRTAQGFDFIKLYSFLSEKEFREAMSAAKRLGAYTAGHIPFAVGLDGVIAGGMNEIAHVEELDFELLDFDRSMEREPREWFEYVIGAAAEQFGAASDFSIDDIKKRDRDRISGIIAKLRAADLPVCTTLAVGDIIVQKLFRPAAFLARSETTYLPAQYLDAFRAGREKHQGQFRGNEDVAAMKYEIERLLLAELKRAGVRLLLGTDSGTGAMGIVPGFSIHDELRILTENGFTPYAAIAAGTSRASTVLAAMTGKDAFGTVEVGKRADLLLVGANPLEDVSALKGLRGVMAAGRWYPRAALDRLIAVEN